MAEWTKMRNTLPSNPKVVGMAQFLGSQRKLLTPLTTGFGGAMLEVVTLDVVVSIVVCGLLRVWGTANEVARDGVLKGVTLEGLDAIAHVPGFGVAMAKVGWARESKRPIGVELPNFTEFNVPVDSRAAERQRRYRDRLKQGSEAGPESNGERYVTGDVTRHDRPDQNQTRVDKKNQPPPTTNDVAPVRAYAREVVGIDLERQLPVVEILADFGLAGVVEMLEHLASRKPSERFKGVRSIPALIKSLLAKAEEGALPREHEFTSFESWKADADARVAAIAGGRARL